jgi:hypothetical protein
MKEEEKYFVPEISDIRIGYEYELQGYYPKEWKKMIIIKDDFLPNYKTQDNDCFITTFLSYYSTNQIRTPFLTKEQIEAKGWEYLNNQDFIFGNFKRGEYYLDYNFDAKLLTIYIPIGYETDGYNRQFFEGECKSINDFHYICKLLKI